MLSDDPALKNTNLFWILLSVHITLESEGLPNLGDDLGEVSGIGSKFGGLQLVVGNVGASSNALK